MPALPIRLRAGAVVAGAAAAVGAVALQPTTAQAVPRHVICDASAKWVPVDYTGGCYLRFSRAVRRIAYDAFATAAEARAQWQGSADIAPLDQSAIIASMNCTLGGNADLLLLNKFRAGKCEWTDTFGHFGLGDHPDHTWDCQVTVVVTAGPTATRRTRRGRMDLQWKVSAAPFQSIEVIPGEFPYCDKNTDDSWDS